VFYLLGLSGVGKTTLAKAATNTYPHIKYIEIDEIIKEKDPALYFHAGNRWPEFCQAGKGQIEELENQYGTEDTIYLCDIGAGCMKTGEAFDYFGQKEDKVILIWDKPEVIFNRLRRRPIGPWRFKPFSEFLATEYTKDWKKLLNAANIQFDVAGRSEQEATHAFIEFADNL